MSVAIVFWRSSEFLRRRTDATGDRMSLRGNAGQMFRSPLFSRLFFSFMSYGPIKKERGTTLARRNAQAAPIAPKSAAQVCRFPLSGYAALHPPMFYICRLTCRPFFCFTRRPQHTDRQVLLRHQPHGHKGLCLVRVAVSSFQSGNLLCVCVCVFVLCMYE
jgi:hypothetical protein